MKKMIGLAMLATTAIAGTASAEVSGNVALTTDYVFRGISQSDNDAAVSGGFDWANDSFYAGTWGSSVGFANGMELDAYAGWTPTLGPVALDLGVIGYFYPGASDSAAELDFYEIYAGGSFAATDALSIGGLVAFSPDFTGETGDALYLELNGAYAFSDVMSVSAAYGNQDVDELGGPGVGEDYNTWNLGLSYAMHGFGLDFRYHDTDIDPTDLWGGVGTESIYDEAFTFSISRAL